MIDHYRVVENTPSVCFNFDGSNLKTNNAHENVDFQYSQSSAKQSHNYHQHTTNQNLLDIQAVTPVQPRHMDQGYSINQKIDTEQFFNEFDNHFVVKFGDSPTKCQFAKHLDFQCENMRNIKSDIINNEKKVFQEKVVSNISDPFSCSGQNIQNQQSIQNININLEKKGINLQTKSKNQYQIRKRINFRTGQSITQKIQSRKYKSKISNKSNQLMIVTSNAWTDVQNNRKKSSHGPHSQPIKHSQKNMDNKRNIFSTHTSFRDTLRSTTLDNWKKKHNCIRHRNYTYKNSQKSYNIFEKPFNFLR